MHEYDKPIVNDILGSPYDLDASAGKSTYITLGPAAIFLLFQYAHTKICDLKKRIHFTRDYHSLAVQVAAHEAKRLCMAVLKHWIYTNDELQVI